MKKLKLIFQVNGTKLLIQCAMKKNYMTMRVFHMYLNSMMKERLKIYPSECEDNGSVYINHMQHGKKRAITKVNILMQIKV